MFPLGDRDLPEVEQKILSYVGARDLVNAKLVSKKWLQGVKRFMDHMKTSKKDEEIKRLLRNSLLEPVDLFATINLPRVKRDLYVNAQGEVFVLSDQCIMELDLNKLQVAREMRFPRVYGDKWKEAGRMTLRALSAGGYGEFAVDQEVFARPSIRLQFKATKSGNYLEYAGRNAINSVFDLIDFKKALGPFGLGWGYKNTYFSEETGRVHATKISEMGIEIAKFSRNLGNRLLDIAWSEDKRAAVFSIKIRDSKGKSDLYGIVEGREPRLIATIPIANANLLLVGTRLICHDSDSRSSKIIVLDMWNPESVRQDGANVTRILLSYTAALSEARTTLPESSCRP